MSASDALKPVDDDSGQAHLESEFVDQNSVNCADGKEEEKEDVDALYQLFGQLLSRRLAELPERRNAIASCSKRNAIDKEDDIADNYMEMFARKRRDRRRLSRRGTADGLSAQTDENSTQYCNKTNQAKRPEKRAHRDEKFPRFLEKLRHCFF